MARAEHRGPRDSERTRARLRLLRRLDNYLGMTIKWNCDDPLWVELAAPLWNSVVKSGALGKPMWLILNDLGSTATSVPTWNECKAVRDHVRMLDNKEVATVVRTRRKRYKQALQGAWFENKTGKWVYLKPRPVSPPASLLDDDGLPAIEVEAMDQVLCGLWKPL